MTRNSRSLKLCLLTAPVALLFSISVVSVLAVPGQRLAADEEPMPPRPPTATPRPPATAKPIGAAIILRTRPALAVAGDLWIVVQWLGGDGTWHDVEGWQGRLDRNGTIRWWVAPFNNSRSNFRWIVYSSAKRDIVITVSDSFALPKQPEQEVVQSVDLEQVQSTATVLPP